MAEMDIPLHRQCHMRVVCVYVFYTHLNLSYVCVCVLLLLLIIIIVNSWCILEYQNTRCTVNNYNKNYRLMATFRQYRRYGSQSRGARVSFDGTAYTPYDCHFSSFAIAFHRMWLSLDSSTMRILYDRSRLSFELLKFYGLPHGEMFWRVVVILIGHRFDWWAIWWRKMNKYGQFMQMERSEQTKHTQLTQRYPNLSCFRDCQ